MVVPSRPPLPQSRSSDTKPKVKKLGTTWTVIDGTQSYGTFLTYEVAVEFANMITYVDKKKECI